MKSQKNLKSIKNSIKKKMKMFLLNQMLLQQILNSKKLKKIRREKMWLGVARLAFLQKKKPIDTNKFHV